MNNFSRKDLQSLESAAIPIVKKAGKYALDNWNDIHTKTLKNERDVVTNIDIEIELSLRDSLHKLLPGAGFIVEEGKSDVKPHLNWSIDPIDGTKNFVNLYPLFSVQVALIFKGRPILGIIYNPVSSQLFVASSENRAKLNGDLITLSPRLNINSAIVDVDFGGNDAIINWKLEILNRLAKTVYRVRMTGGFGSVYVLTGAFDATIYLDPQKEEKYIVDNAPRIILLQEAGYYTEFLEEQNRKFFLAANPILAKKLGSIILS
ncbi:hypothetical protein A2866_00205 [Candidatus Roizmanbacteria bacterium RIFCSPHIGHO2_01_FULL_39_8]|uniref:Inositol monophosphatase n=2 Tax=Candidatus Roizmaniibacteriota TaxID=1752723 RepID=A0A1F7GI23_9BACT|nr:MAG: hypothetical protein A2866_00205 [Candidatus Roizmanbacteria bacterium RIFCSPHIGHO2_01_FULL_39_8]OGK26057.1 MAG: hypothetical protein A3C28_04665 [Candidatus Roizmanbacteria bacterium RIFCSPHIGHO2_02_FULL_39_9]